MAANPKLSNGYEIPAFGLGTYDCAILPKITKKSIDLGYRLFDTAYSYLNEDELGSAIKEKIEDGTVNREDVYIVTKLWNTKHHPEKVQTQIKKSLANLGVDYIDLYLIHWPTHFKKPSYSYEVIHDKEETNVTLEETWQALEKAVGLGYIKSIGLSNFNSEQIDRILKIAKIKPVVNQIEVTPYLTNKKLIKFCKDRGITVMAYSPFFAPRRRYAINHGLNLLEEPVLKDIGKKYKKTAAQVVLRYLTQIGTIPIPKTSYFPHLEENINIFDFTLTEQDIAKVESLNRNLRCTPFENTRNFKEHPFHIEF